jgi:hypothetical protein
MSGAKGMMMWAGAAVGLACGSAAVAQPVGSDEVRAIVAEMLSDAQGRSSLLQGGAAAGHDGRFYIAQPDGSFRLNVGGQIQFRYIINWRDDEDGAVDELETGFQTRRTKLDFTGNIVNKDWTFRVLSSFDRDGGGAGLEEAFVQYRFGNGWNARWGQFKLPMLREELVSSSRQLAAERSVVNEFFTQDRSQGIELSYDQEDWRLALAFSDGLDSENTDFAGEGEEADYAFTGRFEYKFQGTWSRFADFTSRQGDDFASMLGAAAHWQHNDTPGFTDTDLLQYTIDLSLEGDGWNAFGAFVGRYTDMDGADNLNDMGFLAQAGYRFAPETELFARWDALIPDDERGADLEDLYNFITIGLNQYYAGHAAKATIDLVWALESTDDLGLSETGLGLLGSSDDNELAIRLQFQLLF